MTSSVSDCPITYQLLNFTDNTELTTWALVDNSATNGKIKVTSPSSVANSIETYSFILKATAGSSADVRVSMTLTVNCDGVTGVQSEFPSNLETTQTVTINTDLI